MALPFEPQLTAELKARWPQAVEKVWDWSGVREEAARGDFDRPGKYRRHVLDFHGGLRLIVSTDFYGEGKTFLHVSASPHPGTPLHAQARTKMLKLVEFVELARQKVREAGGPTVSLGYVTGPGVVHLFDPPLQEED